MKILYITPRITGEGGLVRVIAMKANYFTDVFKHEVHILTQNNNHNNPFYHFSDKITLHNSNLNGNKIQFLYQYIKSVTSVIETIKPDVVIVCDGLKGFFISIFVSVKIPIIFEVHGSIFNRDIEKKPSILNSINLKIATLFKKIAARKFDKLILLSEESSKEWQVKNSFIIPNPNWLPAVSVSNLDTKKAIAIGRHSYEKGIDRLLHVWKDVSQVNSDWTLDIYGSYDSDYYQKMAVDLGLHTRVNFFPPVANIEEKYKEASLLLMTSRHEGFPMVLIEAMTFGIPCVAFDCPCGPRAIISNNENGILVEDGAVAVYSDKVLQLMDNPILLKKLGENAKNSVAKFNMDDIMLQWNILLKSLIKN